MSRRKRELIFNRIEYIDPADCNSSVGYVISRRRVLSGEVEISDCNRKVSWYFEDAPASIQKIDKAIAILTAFREDFVAARRKK